MSDGLLSWHRAGQKVVCVDAMNSRADWRYMKPIVDGSIYTVREVIVRLGRVGFRLVEIVNEHVKTCDEGLQERVYNASHFRPVRTTDISSLQALLHPTPDDARPFFEETVREVLDA